MRENIDSVVPSAIREQTPIYREYPLPSDQALARLVKNIRQDMLNYWKFDRIIENGGYEKNQLQIKELISSISSDTADVVRYFKSAK